MSDQLGPDSFAVAEARESMLSKLNVLERRVMEVRYFMGPEPLTLEESAEVLAMDPSEVASVEERAILKLSKLD